MYRDLSRRHAASRCTTSRSRTARAPRSARRSSCRSPSSIKENELSLGFRLNVDGKVVLYSGDTGWTETLVTQSQGVDLFICECCFYETRVDFHLDYPRHRREPPAASAVERLVLTHCGREVLAHREEIAEVIASDGLVVDL